MPNCFQLLREDSAVPLSEVDEEMCRHFEVECHPTRYFEGWYDVIGFGLAMGHSFDKIRSDYADIPMIVKISHWLEKNFTVSSWVESSSRK